MRFVAFFFLATLFAGCCEQAVDLTDLQDHINYEHDEVEGDADELVEDDELVEEPDGLADLDCGGFEIPTATGGTQILRSFPTVSVGSTARASVSSPDFITELTLGSVGGCGAGWILSGIDVRIDYRHEETVGSVGDNLVYVAGVHEGTPWAEAMMPSEHCAQDRCFVYWHSASYYGFQGLGSIVRVPAEGTVSLSVHHDTDFESGDSFLIQYSLHWTDVETGGTTPWRETYLIERSVFY